MHQVVTKPLFEGQVRPQDFDCFENEYGYWFSYANQQGAGRAQRRRRPGDRVTASSESSRSSYIRSPVKSGN
jgi:hypothetical protein